MQRIKHHYQKVVRVDTESSDYNTDEENKKNAQDDCEHVECHRIHCLRKVENTCQGKLERRITASKQNLGSKDEKALALPPINATKHSFTDAKDSNLSFLAS